jgi:thioredoxin reductase (NADPH)
MNGPHVSPAIIIGAGPAGLTAACYLGRFRRTPVVLNRGDSRARWIPKSHNTPGFPAGVGGEELLTRLREQALRYGAQIREAQVDELTVEADGFVVRTPTAVYRSRYVILATGVKDELPRVAGAEAAIHQAVLRVCPICDAFESSDKEIAVIGTGEHAFREAQFLQTYSERITLVNVGKHTEALQAQIEAAGIQYKRADANNLFFDERSVSVVDKDHKTHTFDVVYSALGCHPQNQLAAKLGAECDEHGALKVNAHQQTSVSRLYAAGDVVRGLNQIVVAEAEAAMAATDIHNRLRSSEREGRIG